jgi:hypothetical protein
MITCAQIAADAVGLLSLPADAPERREAEAHAETCADCTEALAQARRVLQALDAAAPLPAPSPEALRRAAAPILRELTGGAPTGSKVRRAAAAAGAAIAAWALPLALSRRPVVGGRPLGASLALAALAALATAATVSLGGLAAAAFPLLSAAFSLLVGRGDGLHAAVGVHCALTELGVAAGAAGVAWLVAGRPAPAAGRAPLLVAAVGGGALAAQAALHETCPASTDLPHVLAFHSGPVLLATLLAVALAARARAARPAAAAAPVTPPSRR